MMPRQIEPIVERIEQLGYGVVMVHNADAGGWWMVRLVDPRNGDRLQVVTAPRLSSVLAQALLYAEANAREEVNS